MFVGYAETIRLPRNLHTEGTGMWDKVVEVTASDDISLTALSDSGDSCDGFTVFPTDVLGEVYYPVAYYPPNEQTQVSE